MATLTIKNVKTLDGSLKTLTLEGPSGYPRDEVIEGEGKLTLLPALIDPHVQGGVPGRGYKEDFITLAKAAMAGGVTRVFDMPDNEPQTNTAERLNKKSALIDEQLKEAKIPLRYSLFFGADGKTIEEIPKVQKKNCRH